MEFKICSLARKVEKVKDKRTNNDKNFKKIQSDALGDYSHIDLPSFKFFIGQVHYIYNVLVIYR